MQLRERQNGILRRLFFLLFLSNDRHHRRRRRWALKHSANLFPEFGKVGFRIRFSAWNLDFVPEEQKLFGLKRQRSSRLRGLLLKILHNSLVEYQRVDLP